MITASVQKSGEPLSPCSLRSKDALRTLANIRRQHPNDPEVQKYWEDFLNSVDIKEVVNKPLLPCCTAQK